MAIKYYKREWLNGKEGSAHMITNCESDYAGIYAGVEIMDCNRKASIDFSAVNKKIYNERIKKLDKMIAHLVAFREKYTEAKVLIK